MSLWRPDALLAGFESLEFSFGDDYDGAVVSTLVRLPAAAAPRGNVLYVHGFIDYFFQRHVAERFNAEGYAVHALDLRKHGRSLREHQHPNFCKSLDEYHSDITRAIETIGAPVLLAGHSTGGLVCALYAHEGERRGELSGLWLNSPFFDWRLPDWKRPSVHVAAAMGRYLPFLKDENTLRPDYGEGLLEHWDFDLRLKPLRGFPVYYGWIGAISDGHAKVHRGLAIACPILSMHSDEADIVLDWRDIARWSRALGEQVVVLAFPGAVHDLTLSRPEIREEVFRQLFAWAARLEA